MSFRYGTMNPKPLDRGTQSIVQITGRGPVQQSFGFVVVAAQFPDFVGAGWCRAEPERHGIAEQGQDARGDIRHGDALAGAHIDPHPGGEGRGHRPE